MALSGDNSHPLTTAIANQLLAIASHTKQEVVDGNNNESSPHSSSPLLVDTAAIDPILINNKSAAETVTTDFVVDGGEASPLVLYIAVFVSLGGVIVIALVAVLIWCWCRRLASRDKRLLGGVGAHGSVEGAAISEAQKKEALFKEIRRDIAAVENDGFLRHLEVYMLPQYDHQQGASGDTGWEFHPSNRSHRHHHHHNNRHSYHRNSPLNSGNQSNSNSFLVTSPLSSGSSCVNSSSMMITRSSTMTTTASSLSSYSSASSTGSGSSSHRNHIPKRNCGYGPPSIHDKQWDEEDDDDLVDENS